MEREMQAVRVKGVYRIERSDKNGNVTEAVLELKSRRMRVLPPVGKQDRLPYCVFGMSGALLT